MSDLPTIQEEINRKAFETLQKLVNDFNLGKISRSQYKYGVDIAWSFTSGLVDEEMRLMFEQLGKETISISLSEKTVFRHLKSGIDILVIDSKSGAVVFKRMHQGSPDKVDFFDFREEPNPYLAAKQKIEQMRDALIAKGFVQL